MLTISRPEYSMAPIARVMAMVLFCACICVPGLAAAEQPYIEINSPSMRQIPLAVPDFVSLEQQGTSEAVRNGAETLKQALDYSGLFKFIPKENYVDSLSKGVAAEDINFKNWTVAGAELLITSGVRMRAQEVDLEMRLFDTTSERLIIGKRYKPAPDQVRQAIMRFAAEVISALTGQKSVFNSKVAFVSTTSGHKEIYVCDFDGANPHQVTTASVIALSPAWSPDGKYMAYTAYKYGGPHLFIVNLDKKQGVRVAYPGLNINPAWRPGTFELAATLSKTGDQEIYTLTGDGKVIKRLTDNWGIDVSPSWSPDGKKLAFVSDRSGTPQVYVMNVETGAVRRLTFSGRYNAEPSWSPSGQTIAYAGQEGGRFNIYTIPAEGGHPVQLTKGAGNNNSPTWSPDGSLIAFSSTREGRSRIYVMTSRGQKQRRLVAMPGEQTQPSWSPQLQDE